ncbi:MAG: hypothetical protein ABR604_09250 [Jatrophihabitantaceae bacterium]
MDENRRTVLMAELDAMKKERDDLTLVIGALSARLGVSVDDGADTTANTEGQGGSGNGALTDDVLSLIYANEFFGMTMPKAAEAVLGRWSPDPYRRPLKTTELVKALNKGGLDIKEPRVLYRSLYSTPRFKNLRGGQWGLTKWYPPSSRQKGGDKPATDDEPLDAEAPRQDLPPDAPEGTVEEAQSP